MKAGSTPAPTRPGDLHSIAARRQLCENASALSRCQTAILRFGLKLFRKETTMNIETIVAVIVGAIVTAMLLAPLRKFRFEFIVPEGYAGLLYHHGKFVERLDAGRHIRWGRLWTIQPADLRKTTLTVAGQ